MSSPYKAAAHVNRVIGIVVILLIAMPTSLVLGQVSFSAELAETISNRCIRCHGERRAQERLRLDSFSAIMRGSEAGPVINPRDASASLLIRKMKGEADGDRMPPSGAPLTDAFIAKFEKWIGDGAEFDGSDPNQLLPRLVLAEKQNRLTPGELSSEVRKRASKNWGLALSNAEPVIHATKQFLIVSKAEDPLITLLGKQAENTLVRAGKLLEVSPTLKSPLTLYWIPKRYEFGEFAEMVEKRAPTSSRYWEADGGFGYAVLGPQPPSADRKKKAPVNEPHLTRLVTSMLLSRWDAPRWYAQGLGLLAYERTNRRSKSKTSREAKAAIAIGNVTSASDILSGKLPATDEDLVLWAFAKYLSQDQRRTSRLHKNLKAGQAFEKAFSSSYGKPPEPIAETWLKRFQGKRKKKY